MCRIASFPPNFDRNEALEILKNFENNNTDGTGYVYVSNNKFVTYRSVDKVSSIIEKDKKFLDHMPYDGWTLVHLRAASHGENAIRNTHPFIIENKIAFIHNGIWSDYKIAKLALSKSVNFKGETDSEVAGHLFNIIGPKQFTKEIDFGGVFMALKRNGKLWVSKTSGSLVEYSKKNGKVLLASELKKDVYKTQKEVEEGWIYLNREGKVINRKEKEGRPLTTRTQWYTIPSCSRKTTVLPSALTPEEDERMFNYCGSFAQRGHDYNYMYGQHMTSD